MELSLYTNNRLKVYLDFYTRLSPSLAADQFRKSLVNLYAHLLQFLAHAIQTCQKNSTHRVAQAVWHSDTIVSFERKCDQLCATAADDASNCDRQVTQRLLEVSLQSLEDIHCIQDSLVELKQPVLRVERLVQSTSTQLDNAEHQRVLDWASMIPYQKHLKLIEEKALFGTGEWLFQDNKFSTWQNCNHSQMLWLHGNAGSGKSTLLLAKTGWKLSNLSRADEYLVLCSFETLLICTTSINRPIRCTSSVRETPQNPSAQSPSMFCVL